MMANDITVNPKEGEFQAPSKGISLFTYNYGENEKSLPGEIHRFGDDQLISNFDGEAELNVLPFLAHTRKLNKMQKFNDALAKYIYIHIRVHTMTDTQVLSPKLIQQWTKLLVTQDYGLRT